MRVANYIVLLTVLVACGSINEKKDELSKEYAELENQIFDSARSIHDELMPKMDDIMNSKIMIKEELERIESGVIAVSEARKKALQAILEELNSADDAMMDWMREYGKKPADTLSHEEKMKKLTESLEAITAAQKKFSESLEKSESIQE